MLFVSYYHLFHSQVSYSWIGTMTNVQGHGCGIGADGYASPSPGLSTLLGYVITMVWTTDIEAIPDSC